jgi:hypothetical protein
MNTEAFEGGNAPTSNKEHALLDADLEPFETEQDLDRESAPRAMIRDIPDSTDKPQVLLRTALNSERQISAPAIVWTEQALTQCGATIDRRARTHQSFWCLRALPEGMVPRSPAVFAHPFAPHPEQRGTSLCM